MNPRHCILPTLLTAATLLTGCQSWFVDDEKPELATVPGPPPARSERPAEVQFDEPAPPAENSADAMGEAQVITPLPEDAPATEAAPEPEPEPKPLRTYTIEKGDSYWKIAKKVYDDPMRMVDIEKANPDVDPKKLQVGDEILLPE